MHLVRCLIFRGWQHAGSQRKLMVLYVLMYVCSQAIALTEPWVLGTMLNVVQTDISSGQTALLLTDIQRYLGYYFLIQLGVWSFHAPARIIERCTAFTIANRYKGSLFHCLTQLPLSWHQQHHSGKSIDNVNRATGAISGFFQNGFDLIYMVLRLCGTLVVLYTFMPLAAGTCITMTVLAFFVVTLVDRVLNKQYADLNKLETTLASAVQDYLTNIISVITLRLEGCSAQEVDKRMEARRSLFTSTAALNEAKWFGSATFIAFMVVLVMYCYARTTVAAGAPLLAGTFFALFEYLRRIGDSFYRFTAYYGVVARQSVDVQSAEPILAAYEAALPRPEQAILPAGWKKLSITGLSFSYEDAERKTHHLQDVFMDLELGKTIALVGPSGSGKSTLLSLLRGLQSSAVAEVSVDGTRLEHGLRHLSDATALMPQNPEIFADTIGFNITFGQVASSEEIMECVRSARFEEVLARLPSGLDTNIAEKGVNLSGGERQRLALARGIFFARRRNIILLDEPTSSVDTQNERMIYGGLLQQYKERCVVSAIHKLHLLEMFDVIYVLENGRVVAHGDFKTLTADGGALAAAWEAYQMQGEP
jgi:ATP-binding cassette, subfamily B, bacterial